MKAKRQLFPNPNRLLCDDTLSYSARRVGAALYSHRNRLGLMYLAKRSSCSVPTVRKAVEELERAGYISHCTNLQCREEIGRVGYGRTTYSCLLPVTEDYTLLPRKIFGWSLSHGAFCVCLCLFQQAGNADRAFPSISRIGRLLGMGCATVCRALGAVRKLRAILVLRCKRHNRVFSSNSYYLKVKCIGEVRRQAAASVPHRGILWSFFCSNFTAVHTQMQSISAHRDALIFYKQSRDLECVGSYKKRKNYTAEKSVQKNKGFFNIKVYE